MAAFDVDVVRPRFSSVGGTSPSSVPQTRSARPLPWRAPTRAAPCATSRRVQEAEERVACFLGCATPAVVFGTSMTPLNFDLLRPVGRTFAPGNEILVSSPDHDAGVAPWLELARDRDLVARHVGLADDTTPDLEDLREQLSERTRVVAVAWASNAVGTVTDARRVCGLAHEVGALAWVDAVHYSTREAIDVRVIDADLLLCSRYKFCGPHLGIASGRAEVLETWRPYKARPARGLQCHDRVPGWWVRRHRALRARGGGALPRRSVHGCTGIWPARVARGACPRSSSTRTASPRPGRRAPRHAQHRGRGA